MRAIIFILLLVLCYNYSGAQGLQANVSVFTDLPKMAFGSGSVIDLNKDGVLDYVVPQGNTDFNSTPELKLIAISGSDKSVLWSIDDTVMHFNRPVFFDVNQDGTVDVLSGGRSQRLAAYDGNNGNVLWQFDKSDPDNGIPSDYFFNFYMPQIIPDVGGDQIDDILIGAGGYNEVGAGDTTGRRPGYLMIIDSQNGKVLRKAEVPDGAEIYHSPLLLNLGNPDALSLYFGTGGETLPGHFYRSTFDDLLNEDLSNSVELLDGGNFGYVTHQTAANINDDGILDVIVAGNNGTLTAISGSDNSTIWQYAIPNTEAYNTPAPVFFNADSILDVVCCFSLGDWLDATAYVCHVIDGATGNSIYADTVGFLQLSNPVVANIDDDPMEEILLSSTYFGDPIGELDLTCQLLAMDFSTDSTYILHERLGSGLLSTPLVVDYDQDNQIEVIHLVGDNEFEFSDSTATAYIYEFSTADSISYWGGFWGSDANGIRGKSVVGPLSRQAIKIQNSGLQAFPNPATNQLNIESQFSLQKLTVYSLSGKALAHFEAQNAYTLKLSVGDLPNGMYVLEAVGENGHQGSLTFMKQ